MTQICLQALQYTWWCRRLWVLILFAPTLPYSSQSGLSQNCWALYLSKSRSMTSLSPLESQKAKKGIGYSSKGIISIPPSYTAVISPDVEKSWYWIETQGVYWQCFVSQMAKVELRACQKSPWWLEIVPFSWIAFWGKSKHSSVDSPLEKWLAAPFLTRSKSGMDARVAY